MTGEATNHRTYEDPPLVPPYVTLHPTPDAGTYQEVPARASLIVWGSTSVRMCIADERGWWLVPDGALDVKEVRPDTASCPSAQPGASPMTEYREWVATREAQQRRLAQARARYEQTRKAHALPDPPGPREQHE